MTPSTISEAVRVAPPGRVTGVVAGGKPAPQRRGISAALVLRLMVTLAVVVAYYAFRHPAVAWLEAAWVRWSGAATRPSTMGVWLVLGVIALLVVLWRRVLAKDKRFFAPLLVTCVLVLGDAGFSILESHASPLLARLTGGALTTYTPTLVAIVTTILAEMLLGRFYYGKWPHLASAYVSGISAGILVKSPALWPFVLVGLVSITSKYVLRVGERHLWNPTNLGVTAMLFLAPAHVASLSVQAGNEVWAVLTIWLLGGMILYQLGRFHIPAAFLLAFVPLSLLRAWWTGNAFLTELAPLTGPMFQLYIFFMITDPKTTTKAKWSQALVAVLVAVAETVYRLAFRDVHSLYHALFTVGPAANLIEIGVFWWLARQKTVPAGPAVAVAAT
jgi:hypothetical protein